jgi:hypothetical protein
MRFLALLLLLAASPSWAQGSATLSCTPPTTFTNGAPITGTLSYKFYRGTTLGTYPASQTSAVCATTFTGLAAGTHYFVATANVAGIESAFSGVAAKLVGTGTPNPPTIPQPVSIAGPVYTLLITRDSVVLPEVGSVVAGRPCDPTQQLAFAGKTYMRVDVALVTPYPGQSVEAAWAICGP